MQEMEPEIIVGVSRAENLLALNWAIDETLRWQCALTVVHCLDNRISVEVPVPLADDIEKAQAIIDRAVLVARDRGIHARARLCDGFPGEVLVESSKAAELLVIGSTNRGLLSRSVHESITKYCVRHAKCPLTIIPPAPHCVGHL